MAGNLDLNQTDLQGKDVKPTGWVCCNVTYAAQTGSSTAITAGLAIAQVTTAPSTAPTGYPTGTVPLCFCAADSKIYAYYNGSWIKTAALS